MEGSVHICMARVWSQKGSPEMGPADEKPRLRAVTHLCRTQDPKPGLLAKVPPQPPGHRLSVPVNAHLRGPLLRPHPGQMPVLVLAHISLSSQKICLKFA